MKTIKFVLAAYLLTMPLMTWGFEAFDKFQDPYLAKEFAGKGVQQLDIQSAGSSMNVSAWEQDKVYVEVFVRQNGKTVDHMDATIQEKLADYEVDAVQNGATVYVSIKSRKSNMGNWKNNLQFDLQVKVPKNMSTSFQSSGGSIALSGVSGEHTLRSSGGSIKISDCGGSMTAKSSGGSFSASNFQGDLTLDSSGGSVKVEQISGSLQVNSSGGSITLTEVSGKLVANSSGGSIKASLLALSDEVSMKASGGSISVSLPAGQGMQLEVKGGSVSSQLANFEGVRTDGSIRGTVKGGGVPVTLETSGGSIKIESR
ncbi:DUF4097 family beta strand repeat-containing protein [Mariniradius sediminis]|uniref:DUF4097 domain-containing protein n=1 Tax=Mariniradius sediminis TaxID=2909237 RepID=A0ABS9BNG6_9BACT|nr:DUF4097 family beta strand repeat-containing protein [Mariniradius sediminis]MCF1749605.1 DUF4097 domain-containing protein [Mariniradius sediminis]